MKRAPTPEDERPLPRPVSVLLRLLAPCEDRDAVAGDWEELFADVARRKGPLAARAWAASQVLRSLPMFFAASISRRTFMIKTDLKLAVRTLLKAKGFSFLNVAGLSLGMAVGFLMLLFVFRETSYDRFHEKAGRIYRFSNTLSVEGRQMNLISVPFPLGPGLKESFPEVVNVARLRGGRPLAVASSGTKLDLARTFFADPGFFEIFTIRVLRGERGKMLEPPYSLVLTDETARRLFGSRDPVGKLVQSGGRSYTVTGVVGRVPENSHLRFDALISLSTEPERAELAWMNYKYVTYLELRPGVPPGAVLPKFRRYHDDHLPAQVRGLKIGITLGLQPLTRIHLHSHTDEELSPPGNPAYLRILALIAFFILLLAGINFVTLSTARAGRRAREVGIRKVLGARKARLVGQFLGESLCLSALGLAGAVGLIILILPVFNRLISLNLAFRPLDGGAVLPGLAGMALGVGLLAGLYPAFVLSGFSPRDALKPGGGPTRRRRLLRNGLVTVQYVVSIALICCTLTVHDQLRFLRSYDVGYDRDQLVELPLLGALGRKGNAFKTEVARISGVDKAALCGSVPAGGGSSQNLFRFEGPGAGERRLLSWVDTDGDYLSTLGLTLAAGRDFDRNLATDREAVLVNETLVRQLGWREPLGRVVRMLDSNESGEFIETPLTVIGVVEDYHFESLRQPVKGQVIVNRNRDIGRLLVRLRGGAVPATMAEIGRTWKRLEPAEPFTYAFQSESFDRLYRTDRRLGEVFIVFTLLALFVAGLGLFGLAAFAAERRTKEIGIRKVLGASVPGLMALLSHEFVRWVLLANLVAWPAAYLAMSGWRRSFAYRAAFHPLIFAAAGAAAVLLAIATTCLRTARAAAANPVEALRYE